MGEDMYQISYQPHAMQTTMRLPIVNYTAHFLLHKCIWYISDIIKGEGCGLHNSIKYVQFYNNIQTI